MLACSIIPPKSNTMVKSRASTPTKMRQLVKAWHLNAPWRAARHENLHGLNPITTERRGFHLSSHPRHLRCGSSALNRAKRRHRTGAANITWV
jgi:hypothetical protein